MTNAEYYLKEGINLNKLSNELRDYIYSLPYEVSLNDAIYDYFCETIEDMNGGGYID